MELSKQILELLQKSEPMKAGEIAEVLKVDKTLVDKELKNLKKEEKIISPKRCYYSI